MCVIVCMTEREFVSCSAMLETMFLLFDGSGNTVGIWLPLTYIFYNIIFFYVGLWTIQDKENILPVAIVSDFTELYS